MKKREILFRYMWRDIGIFDQDRVLVGPEEYALSDDLVAAIEEWTATADDYIAEQDKIVSACDAAILFAWPDLPVFSARGLELANWLQAEVGDGFVVSYVDHSAVARGAPDKERVKRAKTPAQQ